MASAPPGRISPAASARTAFKLVKAAAGGDCTGGTQQGTFYQDFDGDGFGNPNVTTLACHAPGGYVENKGDCCDSDISAHPGQMGFFAKADGCGSFDYNCDGAQTPAVTATNSSTSGSVCSGPEEAWYSSTVPACGGTGNLYKCQSSAGVLGTCTCTPVTPNTQTCD